MLVRRSPRGCFILRLRGVDHVVLLVFGVRFWFISGVVFRLVFVVGVWLAFVVSFRLVFGVSVARGVVVFGFVVGGGVRG